MTAKGLLVFVVIAFLAVFCFWGLWYTMATMTAGVYAGSSERRPLWSDGP